nr:unnamed protein product [Callosobruchus analis]
MNSDVSLLSFNIRSICTGFVHFKQYVVTHNVDFMALTETWLYHQSHSDLFCIDSYNLFRLDRDGRGGGVAIYAKDSYNCQIIFSNISDYLEQLWISVKLSGKTYVIGSLYRPPSADVINCMLELDNTLAKLLPDSDILLITGDLNINVL